MTISLCEGVYKEYTLLLSSILSESLLPPCATREAIITKVRDHDQDDTFDTII